MQNLSPACYPTAPSVTLNSEFVKEEKTVLPPQHNRESICLGNPFSPTGGSAEWNSNELILKDECMRQLAFVKPLDCNIKSLYYIHTL